jgi:hypothetical protein
VCLNWSKTKISQVFVCVQKVKILCDIIKHFLLRPETQRQATQHACLPRLLGEGTNKVNKCAVRKIIFCTGMTRAAKPVKKKFLYRPDRHNETTKEESISFCTL